MSDSKRPTKRLVADRRLGSRLRSHAAKPSSNPKSAKAKPAARSRKATRAGRSVPRRLGPIGLIVALVRWFIRLILRITVTITAVIALLVSLGVFYYWSTLPPVVELLDGRAKGSVTMMDRNGAIFAWRGEQFGGEVDAGSVSQHLHNAVVATEDKRFYRHFGISPRGVASAVRINLREGRGPLSGHGGSTITQQTAKLLCLGRPYDKNIWETEREYEADCRRGSLWRKIQEATYALAMEFKYTKEEILTVYMNRAFLGSGARGFEAASQRYFDKSAAEVNAAESAMLAGLLVAPSRYAPTNNIERSRERAETVLRLMTDQGYLTEAQRQSATTNPARLSSAAERRAGGYFADWVMGEAPDFFTRNTTEDVTLFTTLDQRLQKAAEDAMQSVFTNKVKAGSKAQAAIVVMSADGAIRAMVGGRETKVTGAFNRATQAKRQTGSAFKPFVYATALELGYGANDRVRDEPYCLNVPGSGQYCPRNYTNSYKGSVTLNQALAESLNIPAVKISEGLGRDLVQRVARDFGITSTLADSPSMALGASEATLVEMVGAFAGILNGGSSVTPYGLIELRLRGDDEALIGTSGGIGERVINERAARELTWMMSRVIANGTGTRAKLPDGRQAAGKTGTTQAARDAWFIGFTADYVAGVWMGYDDNTPLTGVTGGGLPAEIWRETMIRVHQGLPNKNLPMTAPKPPAPVVAQQPAPQPAPTPQPQRQQPRRVTPEAVAETVLQQVLKDLFGRNN